MPYQYSNNTSIEQELDALTNRAQHVTLIGVLVIPAILILALAIAFGGFVLAFLLILFALIGATLAAVGVVFLAFWVFRLATRFTLWYLGKFQQQANAWSTAQARRRGYQSRPRYQRTRVYEQYAPSVMAAQQVAY